MRRIAALLALAALVAGCADDGSDGERSSSSTTASSDSSSTTATTVARFREAVTSDVEVITDVQYGSAIGADGDPDRLFMDLYVPADDDGPALRPVAIFSHGGGFAFGNKAEGPSAEMARHFAELGYVTASLNYRHLAPDGCGGPDNTDTNVCQTAALEAIHDAQAAVRWFRVHAAEHGVDPDRIAIGGESAGAVMATGVGTWSDSPGSSGNPGPPSSVAAWMSISGGLPGGIFASEDDAPGILFAGTEDTIVPHAWSVETRDALVKVGVPAELVSYDGAGHVPWDRRDDIIERTVAFYFEHLRLAELAGGATGDVRAPWSREDDLETWLRAAEDPPASTVTGILRDGGAPCTTFETEDGGYALLWPEGARRDGAGVRLEGRLHRFDDEVELVGREYRGESTTTPCVATGLWMVLGAS